MNKLAEQYKSKGLVVVGVSDETQELLDKYMADHDISYAVARLEKSEFESAIGVSGFPTAAIISPDGELVWTGHPASSDGELSKWAKLSKRTALLPEELSDVEKLLDKEDNGKAYQELLALQQAGKLSEEAASLAATLVLYLENQVKSLWKQGQNAEAAGNYYTALLAYEKLTEKYPGVGEHAAGAVEKVTLFSKDADIKKLVTAGKKLVQAEELEEEYDYEAAYRLYKSIASKYEGTPTGEAAEAKASQIKDGGLLGFSPHCNNCRQARRACKSHAK